MSTLYHYCSTQTFQAILQSRVVRLSSLTLSNDSKEGAVILDVLRDLAVEADLDPHLTERLDRQLRFFFDSFDGLGFCLSEEPDLLSQWRGYADDARGLAIGFRSEYLEALGAARQVRREQTFILKRLVYDLMAQKELASENFGRLKSLLEAGAFSPPSLLSPPTSEKEEQRESATHEAILVVLDTMLRMFEFKNPAFSEEREWRLVSFSLRKHDDRASGFRASTDKLIPYLEIPMEECGISPVVTVVLGPKHQTPVHVIERFLSVNGFSDVEIIRSAATYR